MKRHTLYVGLASADPLRSLLSPERLREILQSVLAEELPGYTLTPCHGFWQGSAEESARVEWIGEDDTDSGPLARRIARELGQSCVLACTESLDVRFWAPD